MAVQLFLAPILFPLRARKNTESAQGIQKAYIQTVHPVDHTVLDINEIMLMSDLTENKIVVICIILVIGTTLEQPPQYVQLIPTLPSSSIPHKHNFVCPVCPIGLPQRLDILVEFVVSFAYV